MGLVSEYVKVRVNGNNAKYYESLGYFIPRKGNGKLDFSQYLTIKVHDLLHGSNVRVDVVCDRCLKPYDISYGHYYNHNHNGEIYCKNCRAKQLFSGENSHFWNPELTDEERIRKRNYPEYIEFVKKVLARDNYICQCCGQKHGDLEVHHLDGYKWCKEKRTDDTNGITLCKNCHSNFHNIYGSGENTKEQYEEWIGIAQLELKKYNGVLPIARKIFCVETNKIYNSATLLAREFKVRETLTIYNVCNHLPSYNTLKGKHIFWLDEYEKMTQEEINSIIIEAKNEKQKKLYV